MYTVLDEANQVYALINSGAENIRSQIEEKHDGLLTDMTLLKYNAIKVVFKACGKISMMVNNKITTLQ